MSVAFNPRAGQVSALKSYRYAKAEEKTTAMGGQAQDQLELSAEGRQTVESFGLNSMTTDDFMAQVREQLGRQELEVNWNATVDPDGQIWCKAYFTPMPPRPYSFGTPPRAPSWTTTPAPIRRR